MQKYVTKKITIKIKIKINIKNKQKIYVEKNYLNAQKKNIIEKQKQIAMI